MISALKPSLFPCTGSHGSRRCTTLHRPGASIPCRDQWSVTTWQEYVLPLYCTCNRFSPFDALLNMARSGYAGYGILLLVLLSFLVSCEVASAVDESKISAQGSETRRLLRSDEGAELSKVNEEERAITDLSKNLKTWAKNTHVVKNWQLKKAKDLYMRGASYHAFLKADISPEQLYKALDLKDDMRNAMKFYGNWATLHNNPKYQIWRKYDTFWTDVQNKKMGVV
ncbi:hypothetical protein PR002_g25445 [Phytophthora rubi]|uniref:RxLR effector protein n=1 Tax=Phytophthora rubi TaxID=129364 RepID=A0A6A3I4S9_9STRA|nr:hypothetical protein PR002_g25445 [Phytophthora rubi]